MITEIVQTASSVIVQVLPSAGIPVWIPIVATLSGVVVGAVLQFGFAGKLARRQEEFLRAQESHRQMDKWKEEMSNEIRRAVEKSNLDKTTDEPDRKQD